MKIGECSDGRCAKRGLSVMRLALGYPDGIPPECESIDYAHEGGDIKRMLPALFPNREILVWHGSGGWDDVPGVTVTNDVYLSNPDNWLVAHAYLTSDTDAHFVIGEPSRKTELYLAIAVSIEETQ